MTPTWLGRIQTRIMVMLVIAVPWTLLLGFFLPADRGDQSSVGAVGALYQHMFLALGVVLVLGVIVWDGVWHFVQQFRWENDWPILYALLVVVPEGILAYVVVRLVGLETEGVLVVVAGFVVHILSTWILMWLFLIGPIRAFSLRYRFQGGRVL